MHPTNTPIPQPARRAALILLGLLPALLAAAPFTAVRGDEAAPPPPAASPEAAAFFENKIRPVLAVSCSGCHSGSTTMGGLRLDSRDDLIKGGVSGPSLNTNDPAHSLLLTRLRGEGGKPVMPMGGKPLSAAQITDFETWLKQGAPWPGKTANGAATASSAPRPPLWSLQPVKKPQAPTVKNTAWVKNPVDAFVLARLEKNKLQPAPAADRRTLIRRATYDVTGLPPTPAAVEAFIADKRPDAYEKLVDTLLASPGYGENWARHWLDVARYADTKGYVFEEDRNYPNAYTYRDWVIAAFNHDLPYDQFVIQQLAADQLPGIASADERRPLAALGFLTVGRRFLNQQPDIIDDRIDVTTKGFLGLTVSCARCHDHKFDPIPTADYYSLYGMFAASREPGDPPIISEKAIRQPYEAWQTTVRERQRAENDLVLSQISTLRERQKNNETLPDAVKNALQSSRENERPNQDRLNELEKEFTAEATERLKTLRQEVADLQKAPPPGKPEFAMALEDMENPPPTQAIFKRGNPGTPGEEVPRRFLSALSDPHQERPVWKNSSGRLEFAKAIASRDNPLTARVFVNRVWQSYFGRGIVTTPSDFGRQGNKPSHPELLDFLASTFMESGWRIKNLHRLILLSNTYQQSATFSKIAFEKDPDNRLLWRMNRKRLQWEEVRDSLLSASGRLDTSQVGGPAVEMYDAATSPPRRTLYGKIERQNLPGILRTFDFATPDTSSSQRFQTTVPQQTLFLLNSPFVADQTRALAARDALKNKATDDARIGYLYRLLFGRSPATEEVALGTTFLRAETTRPLTDVNRPEWQYGWGGVDEKTGKVSFHPLRHFADNRYQSAPVFPNPEGALGYVCVNPEGGHPGNDAAHASIRRWVAPQNGDFSLRGELRHADDHGDGVEAVVVSSRAGILGRWTAFNNKMDTHLDKITVRKGDTIDFVVLPRGGPGYDSFSWSPVISGNNITADARAAFAKPQPESLPLTPFQRYAQALLMTNEFLFLD